MNIKDFFESKIVSLPKNRADDDFQRYLTTITNEYLDAVVRLDNQCPLSARIRNHEVQIQEVAGWVRGAVRQYLNGQPEKAYCHMRLGIHRLGKIGNLVSQEVAPADLGHLYRMAKLQPKDLSRSRLFHIPFEKRYLVGRHRYGIAGFPCIYLGGSLRVCQLEIDQPDSALDDVGISEFATRRTVKFLDFAYPPSVIGQLAQGRVLTPNPPNPNLDNFIVNYAVCWPIIATCSIRRMHDGSFAEEYIVPQLLLQWLMRETMCDGIRYFSTRMPCTGVDFRPTANYVFPALPPPDRGHSKRLQNLFELTDPCMWMGINRLSNAQARLVPQQQHQILPYLFQVNQDRLATLPKAPL